MRVLLAKPRSRRHRNSRVGLRSGKGLDIEPTQQYSCVMIPDLIDIGSLWDVLPAGIHDSTLDEVKARFATNDCRRAIFDGFERALTALRLAGCRTIYLDGSFVTGKPNPMDFDACWDDSGINVGRLDPVLLDFSNKRRAQKEKFHGECFPVSATAKPGSSFIDFFQVDKHAERNKGIIRLRL